MAKTATCKRAVGRDGDVVDLGFFSRSIAARRQRRRLSQSQGVVGGLCVVLNLDTEFVPNVMCKKSSSSVNDGKRSEDENGS